MLLPTLFLIVSMLVQPVCLAYTKTLMSSAAAEGARLLSTTSSEESCRSFVLRRLKAVPEVALFHVGGEDDWSIEMGREANGGVTSVSISGHARPLPLFGAIAQAWGSCDDKGILLSVRVSERLRPTWLEGSYGDWVGMWG